MLSLNRLVPFTFLLLVTKSFVDNVGLISANSVSLNRRYNAGERNFRGEEHRSQLDEFQNGRQSTERRRQKREDGLSKAIIEDMVQVVGRYLAGHKYNDFDHRVFDALADPRLEIAATGGRKTISENERPRKMEYVRHFPILENFHPRVKKECQKGFYSCLRDIYKVAEKSPRPIMQREGMTKYKKDITYAETPKIGAFLRSFRPFDSFLERFEYRTTASYYMCLFTLQQQPELMVFRKKCDQMDLEVRSVPPIPDYRTSFNSKPYQCALISFCPDPCFGGILPDHKVVSDQQCRHFIGNPCRFVGDGRCSIDLENPPNFENLIHNKINYTCNCGAHAKGFEWNTQFKLCVDTDECFTESHSCKTHQVCRNTPGSYYCACARGYKSDVTGTSCVKDRRSVLNFRPQWKKKTTEAPDAFLGQADSVAGQISGYIGTSGSGAVMCTLVTLNLVCSVLLSLKLATFVYALE